MWRCWRSSLPSCRKVRGAGSAGRGRVRLPEACGCFPAVPGHGVGNRDAPAYTGSQEELGKEQSTSMSRQRQHTQTNKTCTEVFFLSFKCQSGMVWDSAGARPSRVRGAQVLGLSRLKKGLVTCHSSEIWRAAQPVRRLSKLHFDRETPACWMTAYFLMLSHNKSAPEHWKV